MLSNYLECNIEVQLIFFLVLGLFFLTQGITGGQKIGDNNRILYICKNIKSMLVVKNINITYYQLFTT